MSHRWWHFGKSDEEKRLEELRNQEAGIVRFGEGAMELKKNELEQIRKEINQLKIDNPDNETIQSGFNNQDTGGGIIQKGKEIALNKADSKIEQLIRSLDPTNGLLTSAMSKGDVTAAREAVMAGDTEGLTNVLKFNFDKLEANAPGRALSALGFSDPLGQTTSVLNLANNIMQTGSMALDMASQSDFGDNMFANTFEKGLDVINPFVQRGAGIFNTGVTDFTQDANTLTKPIYNRFGQLVKTPFDFFRNTFQPQPKIRFKPKPDPDPVQLTNDQINQIVEDEVNLNPPTPAFSPQDMNIQPAPAPAQPAFSPQDMNIQSYSPPSYVGGGGGMSYRNVVNRANGGLVAVSRYLKGR